MSGSDAPFDRLLGIVLEDVGPEHASATLELTAHHRQPLGMVHGGVLVALIEGTAREGARAWLAAEAGPGAEAATESTRTDFLRAARGDRLVAVAAPLAQARERQTWQVVVRDTGGALVAHGEVVLVTVALGDPSVKAPEGG